MAIRTKTVLQQEIDTKLASAQPDKIQASEHRSVETDIIDSVGQTEFIFDGAITNPKLANNAVSTVKVQDNAISNAKLAQMDAYTVKGNGTGSTADPQDLATDNLEDTGHSALFATVNELGKWLSGVLFRQWADVEIGNSETNTSIFSSADYFSHTGANQPTSTSSYFFPDGSLKPGMLICIKIKANQTQGTAWPSYRVQLGGSTVLNFDASAANEEHEISLMIDTINASTGSVRAWANGGAVTDTGSLDTASDNTLDVQVTTDATASVDIQVAEVVI